MAEHNYFTLNEVEQKRANEFVKKHPYSCGKGKNDFRIRFTSTGVGVKTVIKCMGCKTKQDISDYDSW